VVQEPISRIVVAVVVATGVACARTPASAVPADPGRFEPTVVVSGAPPTDAPPGMVWIPGGEFSMGSDASAEALCEVAGITKDAVPIHRVVVEGFWMDATEVTNEQFAAFVKATAYRTVAERPLNPADYPGVAVESLVPGSAVFRPPSDPVPLGIALQWWAYVPGATWRQPHGPGTTIDGRAQFPVVHVATKTRSHTPPGGAIVYRLRPSGNLPRAAVARANCLHGGMNWFLAVCTTRTSIKALFPIVIRARTALPVSLP
jgi:formylglycine-generating enzyme required for sulfatase activity